ncbi:MAG: halo transducer protein [Haloferacaceae archaeon]
MNPDGGQSREGLDGLPIDAAVEAVLERGEDRDPEAVRTALENVASDGVVDREAAEAAQENLAGTLFTPETRAELASIDVASAREHAEDVADVDAVRTRLADLEARADDIQGRADALGPALQDLLERDPETADLYDLAAAVQSLTEEANAVHREADQLRFDVETFETWLGDAETRFGDLEDDADALRTSLEEIDSALDGLEPAAEEDGDGDDRAADLAPAWLNTTLQHRTLGLTLADLRAELADLRTLADRDDEEAPELADGIEARLEELAARHEALGTRLERLAAPAWRTRYGDRLAAFEAELAAFEPPVDWGAVQTTLREHSVAVE